MPLPDGSSRSSSRVDRDIVDRIDAQTTHPSSSESESQDEDEDDDELCADYESGELGPDESESNRALASRRAALE